MPSFCFALPQETPKHRQRARLSNPPGYKLRLEKSATTPHTWGASERVVCKLKTCCPVAPPPHPRVKHQKEIGSRATGNQPINEYSLIINQRCRVHHVFHSAKETGLFLGSTTRRTEDTQATSIVRYRERTYSPSLFCFFYIPLLYLEHLEEGRLSGVAAGGAGGHHNVDGRQGAHTGRGGHAVGLDDVADLAELAVGEDEPHVSHHTGEELWKSARAAGRKAGRRRDIIRKKTQSAVRSCVKWKCRGHGMA